MMDKFKSRIRDIEDNFAGENAIDPETFLKSDNLKTICNKIGIRSLED